MNENQKKTGHEESPKIGLGEPVKPVSAWKRLLSKRWVYPAAYVAAAAIILTLVWVYQDASNKPLDSTPASVTDTVNLSGEEEAATEEGTKGEEATEVIASSEDLTWPVANVADVAVVKPFYEKEGSAEEHQAALVQYNDTFTPNTGIDLAREDRKPFEVTAAMSGKVTRVEEVPLLGYVVEITHANNLKTVYESLGEVKVKKDAEVKQGDTIGSAGRNEMEKDLDNHVHFTIYENGELVNPATVLPKN
ncbi:Stage II sporulation protein Q [compost metagenome]|uniref:M23 family metallopeptidase n=1 Tax=Paenibacillus rhizolycopersici TaxID=2780073 RepID=A0ABS2HEL4_9BACL|nr:MULTISPECIES: M23 family metallopeptidase [Paenibacillus]MBM6998325.1 M23 family metallopeptidase [Paenibacillus rhizolycopersici]MUG87992.1 peptidoglycan DD-metalloendopeptidase family protein [Paenibacillus timonensis]GIP47465.1 stage II sporulation protein Q [Paenibacillus sp. J53TS2]